MVLRKEKQSWLRQLRELFYPSMGFGRALKYILRRMQRMQDSPHRVALGFACGVLASFSPLFGFHFVVAGFFAWIFGANILASLFGTAFGNPVTFPFIASASMGVGSRIMGGDGTVDMALLGEQIQAPFLAIYHAAFGGQGPAVGAAFSDFFHNVFLPYLVGGILPGALCGVVMYFVLKPLIARYQRRRRDRFKRARERAKMAAVRMLRRKAPQKAA